jgi:hypothetical protein
MKFEVVINLKTAKEMGADDTAKSFLLKANRVIK